MTTRLRKNGGVHQFIFVVLAALWLTVGACRVTATDWLMYGFNLQRTGENPFESILTPSTVAGLHELWSFDLGSVTIMQPVLATGVIVNGSPKDLVYMGAEHGDLYAIDVASGTMVWHRNLGSQQTSCHDMPDGVFGVSGSPFLDRTNNRMFVVGGDGNMYALDLSTGAILSGWPVAVTADPAHEHTYGAVNINNGVVYAETASYCDLTPYHGKIVAVRIATHTVLGTFFPAGPRTNGGGIWGPGGISIDPATGDVFTATGNALNNPENFRYCENVVELSSALRVFGSNYPGLTGKDVDFGATPILYQPPGCPLMVAAKNKTGVLVTYQRGNVSAGPNQRLQIANISDWQFNGIPAWSDTTHLLYISNSSDSNSAQTKHGMVALSVGANCNLRLAWQTTVGPNFASVSPPTVAGGVVYYGDGPGSQLLAFDAVTGTQLWSSQSIIAGAIYGAPMVVNGQVFVGAWDGKLYAFGL
ncbi:MAG: pyrrolo-quinoline quinone [Verrucomicrobia bacterium]|nr:MAG: pyrrolo-quinoline quinone [Verrucomicrobiota bacterium]